MRVWALSVVRFLIRIDEKESKIKSLLKAHFPVKTEALAAIHMAASALA